MNSLSVLVVFRKRECRYMQGIARVRDRFAAIRIAGDLTAAGALNYRAG
jgi:hypothetical protein